MDREYLIGRLGAESFGKLEAVGNDVLMDFVEGQVRHLDPESVFVCDDSLGDTAFVRQAAVEGGEEAPLKLEGHTYHFDGVNDQARDKEHTKLLTDVPVAGLNTHDRGEGLAEISGIMKGIMRGKRMYILFFTLGPVGGPFSIPCLQITDSAYVAHSESILYRPGYSQFKEAAGDDFFRFVHSAGELTGGNTSRNLGKRRVYIDLKANTVYSSNTQYGGNTIGLKKLAMRLAIRKASREGWLCEHMFIMGVHGEGDVSYFAGAYPSACGKTSTSMVRGETIIGDDIAYFRRVDGKIRGVNVEQGIFGIIGDVNSKNDPIIYNALTTPREVIKSNILVNDGVAYWIGKDGEIPDEGVNYSGVWKKGDTDEEGKELTPSHKNARYTLRISELDNMDPEIDNPRGVKIDGIIYGGRDSDTTVPVEESFSWMHGILTKGATLESETTAATLGQEGVRKFNLMSNMDFLSIPLGRYIRDNLDLGGKVDEPPRIFSVNYFLLDEETGDFLNTREDKRVWLKWMKERTDGKVGAIKTPTGSIPKYGDLKRLFNTVLDKDYSIEEYETQFTIRCPEILAKIERIRGIYAKIPDVPKELDRQLDEQEERVKKLMGEKGGYVKPTCLE